ncbi:EAL domain-containing protein [Aestuariibacter sp. A3R04]|uniref:two-component system response regulator n=1 Tax=Aestuariibacter sp. A3R04 TaxID=2841571 RepID=UPI001C0A37F5|nr:EAL domain-containing protein [Aestuariibacter sp. A3R04]MBU3023451.1 EAL domain-containing protein [Aestuariibacter sp. A3R04]
MSASNATVTSLHHLELLIVDDEPGVLNAIRRALRPSGYTIHTAKSGQQAMEVLATNAIAVVLTDQRMPGMSGADLLKYINQFYPQTITMMLSGENDFDTAVGLLNSGLVNKYLTKPWCSNQLVTEIEQAFDYFRVRSDHSWQKRMVELSHQVSEDDTTLPDNVVNIEESGALIAVKLINMDDVSYSHGESTMTILLEKVERHIREIIGDFCPIQKDKYGLFSFRLDVSDEAELQQWGAILRRKLQKTYTVDKRAVYCQVGVGFHVLGSPSLDVDTLAKNLELTILREMHSSHVSNLDDMAIERFQRQQHIRADVQSGLDNNQFTLAFQPKINLKSGKIHSAEVLLRWQHHQLGWVPPAEFVRLAELDGQIELIGEWVIRQGVRAVSELMRVSDDVKCVSMNISAKQLQNHRIVHILTEEIGRYAVNPACIELEVTETAIATDCEFMNGLLWQLKLLGVRISIDDFGAGFTSMSYLSRLPVDVLKLDRSLIDNIDADTNKRELVKSLIQACSRLNIQTVAEGVETKVVADVLKALDCDEVQGFYYSKAVQRVDFEKLVVQQPYIDY